MTIADFVADLRAPTPSAAAEVVSRNQQELLRQVQSARQRLEMAMDYYLANRTRRFTQIHHRLQQQHPQLRLARQQTMLERLQKRMSFALENQLKRAGQQQQRLTRQLVHQNPQSRIHRAQTRIQQLEYRLAETLRAQLSATRERFGNAVTHLEAVSPLSTLARGYSVTSAADGAVLKQVKQVKVGDTLTTRLGDGVVVSEVSAVTKPASCVKNLIARCVSGFRNLILIGWARLLETGCKPRRFRRLNATVETARAFLNTTIERSSLISR